MAKPADTLAPAPVSTAPDSARRTGRQRRPTGAPPPLPRQIGATGVFWLLMVATLVTGSAVVFRSTALLRLVDHADTWFLGRLAAARVGWLTAAARGIKAAGSGWAITALGVGNLAALLVFRRWRHLVVLLGSMLLLATFGGILFVLLSRPRPYGVSSSSRP